MKPISVRFRCFGPYMDEQFLDFSRLDESGLFLICGETGAGKTTILDAICYALYNQSSGNIRGKGLSVMRCKQAQKTDSTLVEFVFSVDGTRYKFLRSLEMKRKNIRDEHQCWEERDGTFVPLFENPKDSSVSAKAQELIGLTYEQFRQVIILPQGQFEKLLVSDSDEKEKILVTLFHAGRWQTMAEELYRRVKVRDNALKLERQQCEARLAEYGCRSTEDLEDKAAALQETLLEQAALAEQAANEAAALQTKKEAALLLDEAFRRLEKQRNAYTMLLNQENTFHRTEVLLEQAAAAAAIQPQYADYKQQLQISAKAEAQLHFCQTAHTRAMTALDTVHRHQVDHENHRAHQEARLRQLTLLESKIPLYTALREQKQQAELTARSYTEKKQQLVEQEQRFAAAHDLWLDTQARQQQAIARYTKAQALYLQSIGGILAGELEPGVPCPVCGSTEHPAPAARPEICVTEAQLEQLNRAMAKAADHVSAAANQRNQAETATQTAQQTCQAAQQEALAAAQSYNLSLEQRVDGIESLSQLQTAIQSTKAAADAYEQEALALRQELQQCDRNAAAAASRLEDAQKTWQESQTAVQTATDLWQSALQNSGFSTQAAFEAAQMDPAEQKRRLEQLTRFRQELTHARTALDEQKQALSGQTAPELDDIQNRLKEAQVTAQTLRRHLDLEQARLQQMRTDQTKLHQKLAACQVSRVTVDADLEFAERLRGSRGLSLQRYVLGVMLSSITAEANRLLKNVYGGRYQLYRSQELGDRRQKSGLDLEVLDHANGQRRSVKTLSGGEKFLVALGLAIGLSTVVQAQGSGVRLGAMFIDEGFGSLDRDAICDALEILDGIRKGSGLVGIISHVDQLADSIPAKIEVKKGRNGSTCVIRA